jgi:hypothetical protein
MEEGRAALEKVNKEMGLALDDWDLDYYTKLFTEVRCDVMTRHHTHAPPHTHTHTHHRTRTTAHAHAHAHARAPPKAPLSPSTTQSVHSHFFC